MNLHNWQKQIGRQAFVSLRLRRSQERTARLEVLCRIQAACELFGRVLLTVKPIEGHGEIQVNAEDVRLYHQ